MSADAPEILLSHYLKTLKLPTFEREYQKLARLCATEGVDHVGYLRRDSRNTGKDQRCTMTMKVPGSSRV